MFFYFYSVLIVLFLTKITVSLLLPLYNQNNHLELFFKLCVVGVSMSKMKKIVTAL